MNLNELAIKYKTDKSSKYHGYTNIYEKYLNYQEPLNLLEIGIYKGASLKMWADYFPNSFIYGIDIIKFNFNHPRIFTFVADQSNREDLKNIINKEFDIIIDDGGHLMNQQQISLAILFNYLKLGGLYVIEDLLTSFIRPKRFNPTQTTKTTHYMLSNFIKNKIIDSDFLSEEECKYLETNIKDCILEKGRKSQICFIKK